MYLPLLCPWYTGDAWPCSWARGVLQNQFLPHVSVDEGCEKRKAYFLGYMIHRLLLCAMNRRNEDDRDHYGNKRLDLAGPLLANLFRIVRARKELLVYIF